MPASVFNNGSLYLHIILTSTAGENLRDILRSKSTTFTSGLLTKYSLPQTESYSLLNDKKPVKKTKKSKSGVQRPVTHWKPVVVIDMAEPISLKFDAVPAEITPYLRLDSVMTKTLLRHLMIYRLNSRQEYLPIVFMSEIRTRIKELWVRVSGVLMLF